MTELLLLDGSAGGGETLRSALALAAITGRPFRMEGISAGRPKPGLAGRHLAWVRAAAAVCGARLAGADAGSTRLTFRPDRLGAGRYSFRARTADSACLLAETVALPLALAGGESRVTVYGGTHVPESPTFGFLSDVWLRVLVSLGLRASARLERPGFRPGGGGELELALGGGTGRLLPLEAEVRATLQRVGARLVVSRLSADSAARCRLRADELLAGHGLFAEWNLARLPAVSPGMCLELAADFGVLAAGFSALAVPGTKPEQLAEEAVGALADFIASGAAADGHLAARMVLPLAIAGGSSVVSVSRVNRQLLASVDVARAFLPRMRIDVRGEAGQPGTLIVEPRAGNSA